MQHGAHERQVNSPHPQRAPCTLSPRRKLGVARGSVTALAGIMGLASLSVLGCSNKDFTNVTPVGGGGTGQGGSAGSAGASGDGGSAGTAQGGSAGAAGSGGSAGLGGTAGSGGSSGSSGGTDAGAPDADVPDGGDAAVIAPPVPTTREEFAAAICASYDALPDCDSTPTCVADLMGGFAAFDTFGTDCGAAADAFYGCMATAPLSSFGCTGSTADIAYFANACPTEEAALFLGDACS